MVGVTVSSNPTDSWVEMEYLLPAVADRPFLLEARWTKNVLQVSHHSLTLDSELPKPLLSRPTGSLISCVLHRVVVWNCPCSNSWSYCWEPEGSLLCGQKLSSSRIEVSHPMASKETVTVVPWALRPNKERDIIEPTPRPNIQTKDFGAKSSHLRG